jgi:hypothetical protein
MLCTLSKVYQVVFWGQGTEGTRRTFKSRASLQFYMRRKYGAGQWRQTGAVLEVLQPYSGEWAGVGYIEAASRLLWCD